MIGALLHRMPGFPEAQRKSNINQPVTRRTAKLNEAT
jgi:hypothetical protein